MKAMIFAAGLGTRLKPWTDHHPKALALVNGKPLLQRNIEYLQGFGIREVVVNIHHFADQIEQAVLNNNGWGSRVILSDERDEVLETGGGLLKARHLLHEEDFFLTMNADILTNLNLQNIIDFHKLNNSLVTLAVMQRDSSRQLLFDEGFHLRGWLNRLTGEEKGTSGIDLAQRDKLREFAFSGIAVYSKDIFNRMQREGKFSLTDLFIELSPSGAIFGYDHTGDVLMDVGSEEKRIRAEQLFA